MSSGVKCLLLILAITYLHATQARLSVFGIDKHNRKTASTPTYTPITIPTNYFGAKQ